MLATNFIQENKSNTKNHGQAAWGLRGWRTMTFGRLLGNVHSEVQIQAPPLTSM